MPTNEYICPECEKIAETFVPLERFDKDVVVCADCGRQAIRLISASRAGDVSDYARKRFPMYDESLNVTFNSITEKKRYLKDKGIVQHDGIHGIKKEKRRSYFL